MRTHTLSFLHKQVIRPETELLPSTDLEHGFGFLVLVLFQDHVLLQFLDSGKVESV